MKCNREYFITLALSTIYILVQLQDNVEVIDARKIPNTSNLVRMRRKIRLVRNYIMKDYYK